MTNLTQSKYRRPLAVLYWQINAFNRLAVCRSYISQNTTNPQIVRGFWETESIKTYGMNEACWIEYCNYITVLFVKNDS